MNVSLVDRILKELRNIRPLMVLLVCVCVQVDAGMDKPTKLVVTDDMGRRIVLDNTAGRIISLAPHITENMFSVGAGSKVVGAVNYSDFPEDAKKIDRVGTYKKFSIETIASLRPDLIIGWASGNGLDKLQQLIDLGFNVYISEPKTLDSIADTLDRFALLSGNSQIGSNVSRAFRARLSTLRAENEAKDSVSVFYQVWNKPLQTLSDNHVISDVIRICGGRNVFGNSPIVAPKIGVEAVLKENPQAIIASGMGESRPEWLSEWLQWPHLQSVRHKDLYFIPPDIIQRHTVRILDGSEKMCGQLAEVRRKSLNRKNLNEGGR